jgi:hypothetical protein
VKAILIATIIILLFGGFIIYKQRADIDKEYAVELVNQNTVKVYSYSSHKLYTVPMDSIVSVFEIDNL